MNYCRCLFMVIIVLSSNAHATHATQPKVTIIEQFDNLRMVSFINVKDIIESPEWSPGVGAIPLSVDEAIQSVKDFIRNSKTSLDIKEIEIRPFHKHEKHWHYLIKIANDAKKSKYDIYVVLMHKKVVPAMIEPQGYK